MSQLIDSVTILIKNLNIIVVKHDAILLQTVKANNVCLESQLEKYIYSENYEMAEYLVSIGAKLNTLIPNFIIEPENLKMIKFMHATGAYFENHAFNCVLGNWELMKYLVSVGIKGNYRTLDYAIETQDIEIIKYVVSLPKYSIISLPIYSKDSLNIAFSTNDWEIINYITDLGARNIDDCSLRCAINSDNLEIIKYAVKLGAYCTKNSLNYAIYTYDLEIIKYIVSLGAKCTQKSLKNAICTENLEIIKYIASLGAKCTEKSLNFAIETKNLEIIKYVESLVDI